LVRYPNVQSLSSLGARRDYAQWGGKGGHRIRN
jgi:hypothetical protein